MKRTGIKSKKRLSVQTQPHRRALAALALAALGATAAQAQQADPNGAPPPTAGEPPATTAAGEQPEEIVVFGRNLELLGTAQAASEGSVGGADLLVRPMLKVAELLESVPGLVAVQHSGSGKANQYFLRGFNLDHGTDFTSVVDGMPWNLRSHGHGQGYLDINGMMPEVVERIDYRKGPYRADLGDFSMAGAAFITTIDRLDQPFVALEAGDYGWRRLAGGGTLELDDKAALTGMAEHTEYDGPWQQPENLNHTAAWGKYSRQTDFGRLAITAWAYHATWIPTEQIPERAIGTPVCANEFCALDPTSTGITDRWITTAVLDGDKWRASAYAQYYDWKMQSDPTYDYQLNQFDRRWTTGGRYNRTVLQTKALELNVGGDFRYDDIGNVGVDHWNQGQFVENIAQNAIKETSLGVYAETTWQPTDRLRVLGGLRGDIYNFDVTAKNDHSFAGDKNDTLASPKIGLAYELTKSAELYGNWGKGFHSNDARGVVNEEAPVPGLSPGTGYEAGSRFSLGALKLTAAYFWLNLDSELVFVGDSNAVEPKGASRRKGYEVTVFWKPLSWLGIDAVYTGNQARYVDNPEGPFIEQSVEHSGQVGIAMTRKNWEASARLRYLGAYALVPDNSQRASPETDLNLRGAYTIGKVQIYGELLNALDEHGKDVVYWYPAYIAGVDPPGETSEDIDCDSGAVNCRMSRAEEPRTLRVGAKIRF
jgi:outer membrane receptor protein involved in Fe transport